MFITHEMLREKKPCQSGYKRFCELFPNGSEYQAALDGLIADDHIDWAEWLLNKFGKTDDVLELEEFNGKALIFAGSIKVKKFIQVDFKLIAGCGMLLG